MNKEKLIAAMTGYVNKTIYQEDATGRGVRPSQIEIITACAEAALKELDNEWVRVDSGQKPNGRLVLCYTRHHDIYICTYFSNTGVYQIAGENVTHFITHFQALPSPPKDK